MAQQQHIFHEPIDPPEDVATPVPSELFEILSSTLGAVREGPVGNEVVHFNGWSYSRAAS